MNGLPTIISHPAVALLHPRNTPARVTLAAAIASILPDLDVLSFRLGIPYGSPYGHRGFTHSIAFALVTSLILTLMTRRDGRTFTFVFLVAVSHPLLDALTNGGRGVALLWPLTNHRYFAPWRPIVVSPIGRFDPRVFWSEVKWIWTPVLAARLLLFLARKRADSNQPGEA
jgi:inner membrane protein